MADEPTCGKGLAEHATLPAKLAELTAALAAVFEFHDTTLDLTDENARLEHDAYVTLAKAFRDIATRLQAMAAQMAGHRDLPMGRHDFAALASPQALDVFERFVNLERDLSALLTSALERDQKMLAEMRGPRE